MRTARSETKPRGRLDYEREARRTPIAEVAGYLLAHLGSQLTAYVSGVQDPKSVLRWKAGRVKPQALAEQRLRCAYEAARLLGDEVGSETARNWFWGSSSHLDGNAPGYVLRNATTPEELQAVPPAAYSFAFE